MQNALLPTKEIINAKEYDRLIHGEELFCVSCKVPVIFVGQDQSNRSPFFKTTGRKESVHKKDCKEVRNLAIFDSLKTVNRYTGKVDDDNNHLIELDFALDNKAQIPHGPISEIGEDHSKKRLTYVNKYSGTKNALFKRITSLSGIAKLLKNSPEELARITFTQQGELFSFSEIVIDQNKATKIALENSYTNVDFIVYGVVRSVIKTEKVMFINFDAQNGLKPFDIFVFAGDFKWFMLTRENLERKPILARGKIKYNKLYNKAEMQVRSNKQIHVVK